MKPFTIWIDKPYFILDRSSLAWVKITMCARKAWIVAYWPQKPCRLNQLSFFLEGAVYWKLYTIN